MNDVVLREQQVPRAVVLSPTNSVALREQQVPQDQRTSTSRVPHPLRDPYVQWLEKGDITDSPHLMSEMRRCASEAQQVSPATSEISVGTESQPNSSAPSVEQSEPMDLSVPKGTDSASESLAGTQGKSREILLRLRKDLTPPETQLTLGKFVVSWNQVSEEFDPPQLPVTTSGVTITQGSSMVLNKTPMQLSQETTLRDMVVNCRHALMKADNALYLHRVSMNSYQQRHKDCPHLAVHKELRPLIISKADLCHLSGLIRKGYDACRISIPSPIYDYHGHMSMLGHVVSVAARIEEIVSCYNTGVTLKNKIMAHLKILNGTVVQPFCFTNLTNN